MRRTVSLFVKGRGSRRNLAYSSVEGQLELISHRGRLRATIKEHGTGNVVRCSFPDEMLDDVKRLFDTRVIAEGLVNYRMDGSPIAITEITDIRARPTSRPLEEFIGTAPNLTGGLPGEDFIAGLRGDD